ncbi:plasminogen [Culex quinquefasciatus]|uniref:Plasminogen n=1 Tax=Culex quinquefasciatus TaxID=7176 RepID=B0WTY0_CULQU|nr:plasminogen [Culex quinquefasciatus]|eukprot:XP_001856761.1 plasminogen [Culex quinquefasciatus]
MNHLLQTTFYVLSLTSLLNAQSTPKCGVPRIQHQALLRYASDSSPGDWPWHAALYHRTGRSLDYACGGTLISEEFVLTAAHCLYDPESGVQLTKRRIRVRLGLHNLDKISSDSVKEFGVEEFYVSEKFQRESLRDDIALLELNEAVRYTDYILPACINEQVLTSADSGMAVGWGVTEDDMVSPVLKQARLPVVETVDCLDSDRDFFAGMIHRCMFCAGYQNGTTVCNGDSGGGLFVERNGVWYLGGIVSFSKARGPGSNLCVTDGYAGFTEVARFVEWIQRVSEGTLRFADGLLVTIDGPDYEIRDNTTKIIHLTSSKLALIKLGRSYSEYNHHYNIKQNDLISRYFQVEAGYNLPVDQSRSNK